MANKFNQTRVECVRRFEAGGMRTCCYEFSGATSYVFAQVAALAEEGVEFTLGTLLRYEWIAEMVRELNPKPGL